jgi:hypothetical protein
MVSCSHGSHTLLVCTAFGVLFAGCAKVNNRKGPTVSVPGPEAFKQEWFLASKNCPVGTELGGSRRSIVFHNNGDQDVVGFTAACVDGVRVDPTAPTLRTSRDEYARIAYRRSTGSSTKALIGVGQSLVEISSRHRDFYEKNCSSIRQIAIVSVEFQDGSIWMFEGFER